MVGGRRGLHDGGWRHVEEKRRWQSSHEEGRRRRKRMREEQGKKIRYNGYFVLNKRPTAPHTPPLPSTGMLWRTHFVQKTREIKFQTRKKRNMKNSKLTN